jgi:hypothetical protein
MTGEGCVVCGRGRARGVVGFELLETAGEWWACGDMCALGDAPLPLLGRRDGFRDDVGEAAAGDCWA